ncbi:MAG: SsrA-binding protein SmpB [Anaerolineae bacterium]
MISTNRKARFEFHIEDTLEAGLVLTGTEIKSVRQAKVSLQDAYVIFRHDEAWIVNLYIAPYDHATLENHEPRRTRKLLMHRREIERWDVEVSQRGYTCIPTQLYLKRGRAKVEIALAKGKKLHDKRQTIAERDAKRRMDRAKRDFNRR